MIGDILVLLYFVLVLASLHSEYEDAVHVAKATGKPFRLFGQWYDKNFNTGMVLVVFLFIGPIAYAQSLFRLLNKKRKP